MTERVDFQALYRAYLQRRAAEFEGKKQEELDELATQLYEAWLQAPNEAVPVGMEVIESGDTWVRDYGVFVEHYHLQALLGLLWACLAVGILLFAWGRVTKSKGQSRQP